MDSRQATPVPLHTCRGSYFVTDVEEIRAEMKLSSQNWPATCLQRLQRDVGPGYDMVLQSTEADTVTHDQGNLVNLPQAKALNRRTALVRDEAGDLY
nr:hypothetical protein CFP56_04113 [Quercus suber]